MPKILITSAKFSDPNDLNQVNHKRFLIKLDWIKKHKQTNNRSIFF